MFHHILETAIKAINAGEYAMNEKKGADQKSKGFTKPCHTEKR